MEAAGSTEHWHLPTKSHGITILYRHLCILE